jgi:hypothetical protein
MAQHSGLGYTDIDDSLDVALATAERVAVAARGLDYMTRVWSKSGVRVYISRKSGDMGYVAVESDGSRSYSAVTKRRAGVEQDIERALAVQS